MRCTSGNQMKEIVVRKVATMEAPTVTPFLDEPMLEAG